MKNSGLIGTSSLVTRRSVIVGAGASALAMFGRSAFGAAQLNVTSGTVQAMPIALPDFVGAPGTQDSEIGRNITGVITNNLRRSGLFAPIDQQAYIEKIANIDAVPRFQDWKTLNAQALVTGRIQRQSDGRVKAQFRLWDVFAGQQLFGQQYDTVPDNWRRIAHIISDSIYERLTGEKG